MIKEKIIIPALSIVRLLYFFTNLSGFIQDFRSSPSSLITQHSGFFNFLVIFLISQWLEVYKLMLSRTWLIFCLRGFIFHDNHKKQGRSSSNSGYKIQNISPRKIYSRTCTFGAKVHISNIRVKRWHKKYETLNKIERRNFCLKYLFIKSNRTALQTYNCT